MTRSAILAALVLAGCGTGAPSVGAPDMVQLVGGHLTLRTTDGLVCRAAVSGSGSGAFEDCPRPFRYDLRLLHRNALGSTGLVEPFADIAITDEAGRVSRFRTPASRDWALGPVLD